MPACIEVERLTKRYGSVSAVSELSITVGEGEVLGLLGPNGAGKSTTLYLLAGLVLPTSGSISIFGKDLRRNFLEIAPRMGVVTDRPAFYEHLSVRKNLLLLSALSGREVSVDPALNLTGLLAVATRKAGTLSTGMRQRLALAQALLTEPELLLLDEPASGLDVEATQEMLHLLARLAHESGVTIVLSSHMVHEVEALCDRVAIMNEGKLLACEKTEAVLSYDTMDVEVMVDGPETAARRLKEQEWVEGVDFQAGRLRVRLRSGSSSQLVAFLVNAGYKVSGAIPRRKTLREYLIEVLKT